MCDDNDNLLRDEIEALYKSLNAYSRVCLQSFPSYMAGYLPDCVQETIAAYFKNRKRLRNHPNPGGWAAKVLLNKMREVNRKMISEHERIEYSLDDENTYAQTADEGADVEKSVMLSEDERQVRQIVGDEKFEMMKKAYGEGIPQKQLAQALRKSESTLRSILLRAKEKVKKEWE